MLTIILLSLPIFLFSLFLMHRSVSIFKVKHLTIAGFFYIFYILRIYIPSFIVFSKFPGDYRNIYMFAVQSVLITFPTGLLLVNWLARFRTIEIKKYFQKSIEVKNNLPFKVVFWLFLLFGVGLILIYLFQIKTPALFHLLKHPGDSMTTLLLRKKNLELLSGRIFRYFYVWLRGLVLPFLTMISLGLSLVSKSKGDKKFWRASFVLSLLLAIFYASLTTAKAPVTEIFLMLLIFLYLFKAGRIPKKILIGFILLMTIFPTFVIVMMAPQYGFGAERLWGVEKAILERIFYTPSFVLYPYFEIFPDKVDFLYGKGISLISLFGQEYFNVSNFVYKYMYEAGITKGTYVESGLANAAFIGDLWANFGIIGVLFGSVLTGMIIQFIQVFLLRRKKTILSLATYAFLVYAFFNLTATSITTTLLTGGVIIVFIIVFLMKILEQFLKGVIAKQYSNYVQ